MSRQVRSDFGCGRRARRTAAALALGRKGFRVKAAEQAASSASSAIGIQLGPNVFPMFDRLGVSDAVLAAALGRRRS